MRRAKSMSHTGASCSPIMTGGSSSSASLPSFDECVATGASSLTAPLSLFAPPPLLLLPRSLLSEIESATLELNDLCIDDVDDDDESPRPASIEYEPSDGMAYAVTSAAVSGVPLGGAALLVNHAHHESAARRTGKPGIEGRSERCMAARRGCAACACAAAKCIG